ncbi:enoyl-CoA hydratase/isomerase family protein [Angustibacter sp. McL0619]|uniref:enoyl-CoA hydratase/isomerase family protein n=1 Tax=Angustibacter sp. McL0619 TaxID=3415676 RepID=UPI003CE79CBC
MSQSQLDVDPDLLAGGHLRADVEGAVLTVTLDRPQARNAQTPSTWRALAAIGDALDDSVRVVVLRAEGESFSAGLDRAMFGAGLPGEPGLMDLARMTGDDLDATIASFQRGFSWLCDDRVISVAVVQGHAVGAGFQLALACDLRIVAEDAQLAMRETSLGLVPDLTGTSPLVRAIGYSRALEVCVTGRWIGAEEAVRIGLASLRVERAHLGAAVDDLLGALTAADVGAVRETKALLRGAQDRTDLEQHAAERAAQGRRLAALAAAMQPG